MEEKEKEIKFRIILTRKDFQKYTSDTITASEKEFEEIVNLIKGCAKGEVSYLQITINDVITYFGKKILKKLIIGLEILNETK